MKRILFAFLILFLAGCSSLAPQATQQAPVATPVVIIQTVLVTSEPPAAVPPTAVPPTEVPPTAVPPTAVPPTAQSTSGPAAAATLPPLTSGPFPNITYSSNKLYYLCTPAEITFTATVSDPVNMVNAYVFVRMEDKTTGYISEWTSGYQMKSQGNGAFSIVLHAYDIPEDIRYKAAFLDFQLGAGNKGGQILGRSDKYIKLIEYATECK